MGAHAACGSRMLACRPSSDGRRALLRWRQPNCAAGRRLIAACTSMQDTAVSRPPPLPLCLHPGRARGVCQVHAQPHAVVPGGQRARRLLPQRAVVRPRGRGEAESGPHRWRARMHGGTTCVHLRSAAPAPRLLRMCSACCMCERALPACTTHTCRPTCPHATPHPQVDSDPYVEVECGCGRAFCFKCGKAPHSPCTCKMWDM